jgi:hypothetical protein
VPTAPIMISSIMCVALLFLIFLANFFIDYMHLMLQLVQWRWASQMWTELQNHKVWACYFKDILAIYLNLTFVTQLSKFINVDKKGKSLILRLNEYFHLRLSISNHLEAENVPTRRALSLQYKFVRL